MRTTEVSKYCSSLLPAKPRPSSSPTTLRDSRSTLLATSAPGRWTSAAGLCALTLSSHFEQLEKDWVFVTSYTTTTTPGCSHCVCMCGGGGEGGEGGRGGGGEGASHAIDHFTVVCGKKLPYTIELKTPKFDNF